MNPPIEPFNFDTRVHYPVGSVFAEQRPDVMYRRVPVYSETIRRQIYVASVTNAAVRRKRAMLDVSAGVPKKPSRKRIIPRPSNVCSDHNESSPTSPVFTTPTKRLGFGFRQMTMNTPVRQKFSADEVRILSDLIAVDSPLLSGGEDLMALLQTHPFVHDPPRTLVSVRTWIRDLKKSMRLSGQL